MIAAVVLFSLALVVLAYGLRRRPSPPITTPASRAELHANARCAARAYPRMSDHLKAAVRREATQ